MVDTTVAPTQAEQAASKKEAQRRSALVRKSRALMPYVTPEELAEAVSRFRFMIPGGDKMTDRDIWALSQVSLSHGLNPLIGECTWINGFFPQIRGLRRKGREQLLEWFGENGIPTFEYRRLTEPADLEEHGIPPGAFAIEITGTIPHERQDYAASAEKLAQSGAPWERIEALLGTMPKTKGYGYLTAEEVANKAHPVWWHVCKNSDKNTRNIKRKLQYRLRDRVCPECGEESWKEASSYPDIQHAQKRAEAHWWKLKCDLPFDVKPSGEGMVDHGPWEDVTPSTPTDVIDGQFKTPSWMGHEIPTEIKTPADFQAWQEGILEQSEIDEDIAGLDPDARKEAVEEGATDLFGEGETGTVEPPPQAHPEERPYPAKTTRERWEGAAKLLKGKNIRKDQKMGKEMSLVSYVAWQLSECFAGLEDAQDRRHSVMAYLSRGQSTSLNDEYWTGARLMATVKWLEPDEYDGDGAGLFPRIEARREALLIVTARLEEQGQEKLDL